MSGVERVVIIGTDRPEPVYHRFSVAVPVDRSGVQVGWNDSDIIVARTQCGRRERRWRWWCAHVRRSHADLFARPCRTCFPEARS